MVVSQRAAVAASCVALYALISPASLGQTAKTGILVLVAFLACLEKLGSIANMVAVEKDWVRLGQMLICY
jgi:solute carrier family 40 (iron-regulated transporter), member 1